MTQEKWPVKLPDYRLDGKVAIVTGGTKGIGYAIAMMFAAFGASVVVSSRHQEECDSVADQINQMGGSAVGLAADVGRPVEVAHLVQKTVRILGDLNILVNCAGIAITKPILEMDEEDYDKVMDTNLRSVFFASKEAATAIVEKGHGGRIIQIASIGALKGTNQLSTYCASKAAVLSLTKTMALEWSRYGITTTALFLASDYSSMITGSAIVADMGAISQ